MSRKFLLIIISIFILSTFVLEIQKSPFKPWIMPISTLSILIMALVHGNHEKKRYFRFIIMALILCVIGDVIPLIWDVFILELIVFLFAKYFFCEAFLSVKSKGIDRKLFVSMIIVGLVTFALLSKNMGEYMVPSFLFVGVTIYFVWSGIKLHTSGKLKKSKYIFYAVLIWFICDIFIGIDRFTSNSHLIGSVVVLFYLTSLLLIALSLLPLEEKEEYVTASTEGALS